MAKLTQKTYRGYNITAVVPNFAKCTFEERTIYIAKSNDQEAIKIARKELNIPVDVPVTCIKVEKTMVVPTMLIDEVFTKYGREKRLNEVIEADE